MTLSPRIWGSGQRKALSGRAKQKGVLNFSLVVLAGILPLFISFAQNPSFGADTVITFPSGITFDPGTSPFDLRGDVLAISSFSKTESGNNSKVFQIRQIFQQNRIVVFTDFPGHVYYLQLSPTKDQLLVFWNTEGMPEGTKTISLLNSNGDVLWSRTGTEYLKFSSTGESLLAYQAYPHGLASEISVFNLQGTFLRKFVFSSSIDGGPDTPTKVRGLILLGDGSQVISATKNSLWRVVTGEPPESVWRINATGCNFEYNDIEIFNNTYFLVHRTDGGFQLHRLDSGNLTYTFDPDILDQNDGNPNITRDDWVRYKAFPGSSSGTATLFNRTSSAFTLNIETGTLTPISLNTYSPPGAVLDERINQQRLVIVGLENVRIRPIGP